METQFSLIPAQAEPNLAVMHRSCEDLLREMVSIDSPTEKIEGVNQVQSVIARELLELGFEVRLQANPDSNVKSGDFLIAEFPGEKAEFITMVSHADTVLSHESYGIVYERLGMRARGSGVIDNKGGLAVALQGLRLYFHELQKNRQRPPYSIRVLSSPNEEGGSLGFHDLYRHFSHDSVLVLGFEPALDNGSIIESRRGNRWYRIAIEGQEAHAGRCHGEQINAAHDLAIKIAKLHKLNDPKSGVAVNISQITGGRERYNVVCGGIQAKLDTRFPSFSARDRLHRKIEKILLKPRVSSPITGKSAETSYVIVDDCPPFHSCSDAQKLLKLYKEIVSSIEDRIVHSEKAGGAGDVNHMSREGVIVIDGLGPMGGKMHTTEEYLEIPTLLTRAQALARFLNEADKLLSPRRRFRMSLRRRHSAR